MAEPSSLCFKTCLSPHCETLNLRSKQSHLTVNLLSIRTPNQSSSASIRVVRCSTSLPFSGFALRSALTGKEAEEYQTINSLQQDNDPRTGSLLSLREVEKILGYNFLNQSLLEQAFTHVSYHEKCLSYERLEYVGDSVLNLLITKQQFFMYPNLPPGQMSPLRAANVNTEKLARVAVKHNLHKYILHRNPMLRKQIREFIAALPGYPLQSNGLIDAPKVLADIVESTIGAVFIDSNSSIETTWEVVHSLLEPVVTLEMFQTPPVQKLYETCQKHRFKVELVDLWLKEGTYEVLVDNQLRGRGKYRAKKDIALNRAANDAYNEIVKNLGVKHDNDAGS